MDTRSFSSAVLRGVSDALATYGTKDRPLDVALARIQHAAYEKALADAGVRTTVLPEDPALADCCFVEDNAVMSGKRALITRMGFVERRPETSAMREHLDRKGFEISEMLGTATLDGGDVLIMGDKAFVGMSRRTNERGFESLRRFLAPDRIKTVPVLVKSCLHLKTACTQAGDGVVVLHPLWVDERYFKGYDIVSVPEDEPLAANVLLVNGVCLMTSGNPRTRDMLLKRGVKVVELDTSEFAKADGGLTCLSVLLP